MAFTYSYPCALERPETSQASRGRRISRCTASLRCESQADSSQRNEGPSCRSLEGLRRRGAYEHTTFADPRDQSDKTHLRRFTIYIVHIRRSSFFVVSPAWCLNESHHSCFAIDRCTRLHTYELFFPRSASRSAAEASLDLIR